MNNFIIRKAIISDVDEIIDVSNKTWITTYKGLLSDKFLNNKINMMDEEKRRLEKSIQVKNNYYVVVVDNRVVGFVSYSKSRNEKYENYGKINALYVLKEYQGLGIGKALFIKGIEELSNLGFENMILNVLDGNNAINFYKYFGGKIIDKRYDYFLDELVKENILLFKDINNIKSKRK